MEDQIKSLQQETLAMTRRIIALEARVVELQNVFNEAKMALERTQTLETRIKTLEEARVRQIELNSKLSNKQPPAKSLWDILRRK